MVSLKQRRTQTHIQKSDWRSIIGHTHPSHLRLFQSSLLFLFFLPLRSLRLISNNPILSCILVLNSSFHVFTMTQTRLFPIPRFESDEDTKQSAGGDGGGTAMRLIVPLQGVVQGRGGLFWGSVIPCALFYFLQLYFKRRHRSQPNSPPPTPSPDSSSSPPRSPITSSDKLSEVSLLPRSLSRLHLSPRSSSGSAFVSGRANSIAKTGDSPYYVGLKKVAEDPYHEIDNPNGIIQLGLAENKVRFALVMLMFDCVQLLFQLSKQMGWWRFCSYPWTWFKIGLRRMRVVLYCGEEKTAVNWILAGLQHTNPLMDWCGWKW